LVDFLTQNFLGKWSLENGTTTLLINKLIN
jgi:hypothetical protein